MSATTVPHVNAVPAAAPTNLAATVANGTVTFTWTPPARRLTLFDQEFVQKQGKKSLRKTFTLAFRTLSVPQMVRRLEKAGLEVSSLLGDYQGGPWDARADVWILLARKTSPR